MAVLTALRRSRVVTATVAIALLATAWPALAQTRPATLEYAVKANYLYKFAPFVDWPVSVFAAPSSPFNVCILGDDPFGGALDEAIRGQTVDGRPVAVRRLSSVGAGPECQVLYVGRSKVQKPADALQAVRGAPVLTVTDERLGDARGIVHFILRDGRVRFEIDLPAAQASGLTLSSKLLALSAAPAKGGD